MLPREQYSVDTSRTSYEIYNMEKRRLLSILRMISRTSLTNISLLSTKSRLTLRQVEPTLSFSSLGRPYVKFIKIKDNKRKDSVMSEQQEKQRMMSQLEMQNKSHVDEQGKHEEHEECEERDEDYSVSASAIILRRNSSRRQSRRKRRTSSTFTTEGEEVNTVRRQSSAYTNSSIDTAISIEDSGTQEQVFEKLKLHKEVLSGVKEEPWPLRKKMKLVRQAKLYVRKHEGVLQERLAQNRNTKDVIARISLLITKKWQYFRRELINLKTWLIPWELRIKEIESHFGSAVASYFTFLRWLFWINFVITILLTAFVVVPEMFIADVKFAGERKIIPKEERIKSSHLTTLWKFEGILRYSPFFYGWYTNHDSKKGYRLPLAYFVTNLVVYTYSFVVILRKMAKNSRQSKLTEKEDECAFSWKLFTGWDFMIGNPETAHNRVASIVLSFKEALLEEAEKEKDKRNWKIILMRSFVHISVLFLLALSAYIVVEVVARSTDEEADKNLWRQNEITLVMSLISYVFPIIFEVLGLLESYHPRKQLRRQLARIMLLNLLNLYSLIFALFNKISYMKEKLIQLNPTKINCKYTPVKCVGNLINSESTVTLASLSLALMGSVAYANITDRSIKQDQSVSIQYEGFIKEFLSNDNNFHNLNYGDYNANSEDYYNSGDYSRIDNDFDNTFIDNEINNTWLSTINNNKELQPTNSNLYINKDYRNTESFTENSTESNSTKDISGTLKDNNIYEVYNFSFDTTKEVNNFTTEYSVLSMEGNDNETNISNASNELNGSDISFTENIKHIVMCYERVCTSETQEAAPVQRLDLKTRKELRRLCWETMYGQELAKLTVMDLVMTIVSTLGMDFFRAVFIRCMNNCWCWDLEKQFPQYGDFKIAENILHLVNNQGMVWMGMFFSPGLAALNLLKLGILMYLRSWAVLTCNVPHEIVFRASRSNNFYFALLLMMLFLCVLPVGYAIVRVEPSWHCGPFSGYSRIYMFATKSLKDSLPEVIKPCLDYISSASMVIPLIVLMTLIIYYMASLTGSLREVNNDLKIQLRQERTEKRRKLFKITEKRHEAIDTSITRWKKILPVLPSNDSHTAIAIEKLNDVVMHERKYSITLEEVGITDTETESLPHDFNLHQKIYEIRNFGRYDHLSQISFIIFCIIYFILKHRTNIFSDSLVSPSSKDAIIPEIRINEVEDKTRKSNSHSLNEKN
ncbi:transmembrane channel-like protein isoform X2 [Vespa crabro]|uniref:transmembrane channel-like protein isoform X2 n=1 Tax=Vespa crabro TaxID=7445 RepID=UPI001F004B24|nr:transmembrane channel-like protein isoform X2 [Vespa crabro]